MAGFIVFPRGKGNGFFHHHSMLLNDHNIESIAGRSIVSDEVTAKYNLIITIKVKGNEL